MNREKLTLKTWGARQAVAILGVDNIKVSDFGLEVLLRIENGLITHEEAKEEILSRARARAQAIAIKL